MAGKPVGFALALVSVFVAAVVLGRLLLDRGEAWVLVALACPLILVLLARLVGLPAAVVVLAAFVLTVLASRSLLAQPKAGWIVFLLVPVAALTTGLAASVVRSLASPRQGPAPAQETVAEENGENGEERKEGTR